MVGFLISKRGQLPFKNWEANKNITNIEENHKITQKQHNKTKHKQTSTKTRPHSLPRKTPSLAIFPACERENRNLYKKSTLWSPFSRAFFLLKWRGRNLNGASFGPARGSLICLVPRRSWPFFEVSRRWEGRSLGLCPSRFLYFRLSVFVYTHTHWLYIYKHARTYANTHTHIHRGEEIDR